MSIGGTLKVDNIPLSNYGVYVSGKDTFTAPRKNYNFFTIPYRNGELLGLERRLDNINVVYRECGIVTSISSNLEGLRNFLLSRDGYVKIEDSYHPNEYRMGVYEGGFEADVSAMMTDAKFDLIFNCMPQRWLKSGDTVVEVTSTKDFNNPSKFASKPLVRVYGYGQFMIGGLVVQVQQHTRAYIDIDCDRMDCYCGKYNMNEYVDVYKYENSQYYSTVDFPTLPSGNSSVTIQTTSTMTKLEVTPRWWIV